MSSISSWRGIAPSVTSRDIMENYQGIFKGLDSVVQWCVSCYSWTSWTMIVATQAQYLRALGSQGS